MLNKDKIENFAFNCDRPFSIQEAADLCNVSPKKAQLFVKELKDEGKIILQRKVRQKHFYIWKGKTKLKKSPRKNGFTGASPNEKGNEIEQIIKDNGYTSLRDIAHKINCSYEFVRLVIANRGLVRVNVEKEYRKQRKAAGKDLLKILRTGKKVIKKQRQSVFLESISAYPARV